MIEAEPGATFSAFAEDFDTGLVGTLTVAILGLGETVHTAATAAGIYESPAGSGNYGTDELIAPEEPGTYRVYWDDQDGTDALEELVVLTGGGTGDVGLEGVYTDTASLRAAIGVDAEVLPDAEAERLIRRAEDLVDELLGARSVDHETGRKVDPESIAEWRALKLEDATNLLAKFLFQHPDWELEQRYSSVGGDQSVSGPYGSPFPGVMALLNASGLRVLTTRATGSARSRGDEVIGNLPEPD